MPLGPAGGAATPLRFARVWHRWGDARFIGRFEEGVAHGRRCGRGAAGFTSHHVQNGRCHVIGGGRRSVGRRNTASATPVPLPKVRGATNTAITNAIFVMFENHTFDNYFGLFPGLTAVVCLKRRIPCSKTSTTRSAIVERHSTEGKLDGFQASALVSYSESDYPIFWNYARQFGLGDNFFTSATAAAPPIIST